MKQAALTNLQKSLLDLAETKKWLHRSFLICQKIGIKKEYTPEEFDAYENLTSRFSRTSDLLINKVYRAIDQVELEPSGTIIDILNKAEKRNLVDSVQEIREIKELRNMIAHDYANSQLKEIFQTIFKHIPVLSRLVDKAIEYGEKYLK